MTKIAGRIHSPYDLHVHDREGHVKIGVLGWDRGGVSYVLAGSVPTAAAESAARELK